MQNSNDLVVATCIYGASLEMVEMLSVYAYSVGKHLDAKLIVYHDGIFSTYKNMVRRSNPDVVFRRVNFEVQQNHKPSQKIKIWRDIVEDCQGTNLILTDFDVLFIADPSDIFGDMEADRIDLCYTFKDNPRSRYRLNTGVVFVANARKALPLFDSWIVDIAWLAGNGSVARQEVEKHGALDQAALMCMTGGRFDKREIEGCMTRGAPCGIYNHHKDWEIVPSKCCVIHFKGGWPKVLLQGDDYEAAAMAGGWGRRLSTIQWQPCFDLWRQAYRESKRN